MMHIRMDYYARLYEMSEYYDFKNETLPFADESKHRTWNQKI